MSVLIRKLSKKKNASIFRDSSNIDDVSADAVVQEFKTSGDTLSVWETTKDSIDLGILAVALSSEHIDTMDFIVLDKESTESIGLHIKATTAEANPLVHANEIHRDIVNLRLQDFHRLASVYRNAAIDNANILRYTKAQLHSKISEALKKGWIDSEKVNDKIRKVIDSIAC